MIKIVYWWSHLKKAKSPKVHQNSMCFFFQASSLIFAKMCSIMFMSCGLASPTAPWLVWIIMFRKQIRYWTDTNKQCTQSQNLSQNYRMFRNCHWQGMYLLARSSFGQFGLNADKCSHPLINHASIVSGIHTADLMNCCLTPLVSDALQTRSNPTAFARASNRAANVAAERWISRVMDPWRYQWSLAEVDESLHVHGWNSFLWGTAGLGCSSVHPMNPPPTPTLHALHCRPTLPILPLSPRFALSNPAVRMPAVQSISHPEMQILQHLPCSHGNWVIFQTAALSC